MLFTYLVTTSAISSSTIMVRIVLPEIWAGMDKPPKEALVEFTGDLPPRIPYRKILIYRIHSLKSFVL